MIDPPSSQPRGARGSSEDMPTYFHTKFGEVSTTPKSKGSGKKIIETKIGNSQESPSYFRTTFGLISPDTYNNPYIQVKVKARENNSPETPMKNKQTFSIFNKLTEDQKKEYFYIKEVATPSAYNLVTHSKKNMGKIELQINERAKFNEDYKAVQKLASTPFHRKTNYFSDFVERNDVMNVFGGLNTRERLAQFCKVKDYSLDETQQTLIKSIRDNSRPSSLWKNPIVPKININNQTSESLLHIQSNNLLASEKQIGRDGRGSSISGDDQDSSKIFQLPSINRSSRIDLTDKQPFKSTRSRSKVYSQYAKATLGSKIPSKIPQIKYDIAKEEEIIKELQCIADFEQHLKFIQGNDSGGSKMGSVFFKDSKR